MVAAGPRPTPVKLGGDESPFPGVLNGDGWLAFGEYCTVPALCQCIHTGGGGLFTSTDPESRRIKPEDTKGRVVVKVVYTVLEAQYQSALSQAVRNINDTNNKVGMCRWVEFWGGGGDSHHN